MLIKFIWFSINLKRPSENKKNELTGQGPLVTKVYEPFPFKGQIPYSHL